MYDGIQFDIELGDDANVGVTDQIFRWKLLFNVGALMKWQYQHRKIANKRSSETIVDHIGLNLFFSGKVENSPKVSEILNLNLGAKTLERNNVRDLRDLTNYLQKKLKNNQGVKKITLDAHCGGHRKLAGILLQKDPSKLKEAHPIEKSIRKRITRKNNWEMNENENLRVLIHMRLGDTANIKTPWGVLGGYRGQQCRTDPSHFYYFIDQLKKNVKNARPSIRVFSDGYERICQREIERLANSDQNQKKCQFVRAECALMETHLRATANLIGHETFIGENDNNLQMLLSSTAQADLIVTSSQQRMIPKLLWIIGIRERKPTLVILEDGVLRPSKSYEFAGANLDICDLIQLSFPSCDLKPAFSVITDKLSNEKKIKKFETLLELNSSIYNPANSLLIQKTKKLTPSQKQLLCEHIGLDKQRHECNQSIGRLSRLRSWLGI